MKHNLNKKAGKIAIFIAFLCFSYGLSAQELNLISGSVDKRGYFEPLENVILAGVSGSTIKVFDGKGLEYVSMPVSDDVSFRVGGSLGEHLIVVYDKKGKELSRKTFKVDAKTRIDDGGRYADMFNLFYKGMCVYSENGVESATFKGKNYNYFVSWGLDHYHTLKGMQYFSPVGYEYLDLMRESQREDGLIWSFILKGSHYYYETCYGPFGYFGPLDEVAKTYLARQTIENHCEYIYVNSVYQVWKSGGDFEWMKKSLQSCAKALDYSVTDIDRYSEKYGLLKRVYTIDSWDFQIIDNYLPDIGLNNSMLIDAKKSKFGIFYGDNSGYADACDQLSEMFNKAGDKTNAEKYIKRAAEIREKLNNLSWNGRFFTHFVEEDDNVKRDVGVDEKSQISLSNCYTVNRGFSHEQNKKIIESYIALKDNLPQGSPGEWYAIYPPFERGFEVHNAKWQYMNGGIAGHAAGELARGAYENGYEDYATDVLNRLQDLGHRSGDRIWFAYTGAFETPPTPNYTTIDLKKYANMDIAGGSRGKALNWMFSSTAGADISSMPTGLQTFDGKNFYVVDPETNDYRSTVAISSRKECKQSVEIEINKSAACVYLMHSGTLARNSKIYADVVFVYEDGTTSGEYLESGKQLGASLWYPSVSNPYSGVAWRGPNIQTGDVGVYWGAVNNPFPEKKIKSLVFNSALNNSLYVLLGITLSDQKHYVKANIESTGGPDNWAAGTAMFALVEGLAGVRDKDVAYNAPIVSPRWLTSDAKNVDVTIRYAASDGYVAYKYKYLPQDQKLVMTVTGNAPVMDFHILLPKGFSSVKKVESNGLSLPVSYSSIENSKYVDFSSEIKSIKEVAIYF